MPIEDMEVFIRYEEVADWVWDEVGKWDKFDRDTVGIQLVRAADSIGANLVEGDGRYGIPDSVNFFIYARGSARETRLWIKRARRRNLLGSEADEKQEQIKAATQLLNNLIRYRRSVVKSGPKHQNTALPDCPNT
jgi:four helix bundle protein